MEALKVYMKTFDLELNNGVRIPAIGFGTYKAPDDAQGIEAVRKAIECGYRLIIGSVSLSKLASETLNETLP
ncbi:MAG: hypothetical protein K2M56_06115 [Muribaculaceae bacterium]|nr:hypothetical protein [Muribaculaceae bacterium]